MATVDLEVVSAREAEVLYALRDHLTNAEIAQRLHISVRTVESHVSSLLRKLGAVDRRQLAALADEMAARAPFGRDQIAGLPAKWTSFVGREAEIVQLSQALAGRRLVTVVGPAGWAKRGWPPWWPASARTSSRPEGHSSTWYRCDPSSWSRRWRPRSGSSGTPRIPCKGWWKNACAPAAGCLCSTAASTCSVPQPPSPGRSWPLALRSLSWPPVASVLAS